VSNKLYRLRVNNLAGVSDDSRPNNGAVYANTLYTTSAGNIHDDRNWSIMLSELAFIAVIIHSATLCCLLVYAASQKPPCSAVAIDRRCSGFGNIRYIQSGFVCTSVTFMIQCRLSLTECTANNPEKTNVTRRKFDNMSLLTKR